MELPRIRIGNHQFTRLILGNNPISGVSHYSHEVSAEMERYFTMENAKALLHRCEKAGINTFQGRADRWIFHLLREYWNEGGKMKFICQTASEMKNMDASMRLAAKQGAVALYHHGTETDNFWREGRIEEVREVMKFAKDLGILSGIGSHTPEVIEYIEENGWDVDFYMTSFYNVYKGTAGRRESSIVTGIVTEDCFDSGDRDRMCATIRKVAKPCLAFKILAAGRHCGSSADVRKAFKFAFEHIKEQDAVVVGMFPRGKDQVEENTAFTREYGSITTGEPS